jgi:ABC-2 type transport system permease protein
MIPGLVGVVLVIAGTIATALGVVRERQAGTLEQLAVMPFRAGDVFLGKVAPYLVMACFELVIVTLAGIYIFDVPFVGSVAAYALGSLLFLFVTLGIGVLISTVSQTQGQAIQMAMVVMVPQILLSGFIFPLNAIVPAVRWISYLLPLTYFVPISRGVWVRGAPISSLWVDYVVLAGFALAAFGVSVVRFRRDLAVGSRRTRGRRKAGETPAATAGEATPAEGGPA